MTSTLDISRSRRKARVFSTDPKCNAFSAEVIAELTTASRSSAIRVARAIVLGGPAGPSVVPTGLARDPPGKIAPTQGPGKSGRSPPPPCDRRRIQHLPGGVRLATVCDVWCAEFSTSPVEARLACCGDDRPL
jgi:hypothetical protein